MCPHRCSRAGKAIEDGIVRRVSGPAIENVLAEIILKLAPQDPEPLYLRSPIPLNRVC